MSNNNKNHVFHLNLSMSNSGQCILCNQKEEHKNHQTQELKDNITELSIKLQQLRNLILQENVHFSISSNIKFLRDELRLLIQHNDLLNNRKYDERKQLYVWNNQVKKLLNILGDLASANIITNDNFNSIDDTGEVINDNNTSSNLRILNVDDIDTDSHGRTCKNCYQNELFAYDMKAESYICRQCGVEANFR